jgi:hypothetical protein
MMAVEIIPIWLHECEWAGKKDGTACDLQ